MASNRSLTTLGFIGYLLIGTAAVLMPSVMPLLTAEYTAGGLSLAGVGFVFPAMALGGILGNLLSGIGSDVKGRTRSVWLAAFALAGALTLAALAGPWLLFLAALIAVGTAQGGLSTGINALIADVNRQARARALNNLHGIYGIGAALSPLIFGAYLAQGLPWRGAMAGVALVWLLYGLGAWRFDRRRAADPAAAESKRPDLGMLRAAPFLALFTVAFIYNGVAYSLLGWVALFMQETAGFTLFASISMVSVFYIGLTVGRFLCAAFSESIGYGVTLLILAVGITLTYPLVVMVGAPWLMPAGIFLTGLSLSGLFPTAMAFGTRLYPEQTGTLSGTLNVGMTLGAMIPPVWTGFLAARWGFQAALAVNYGLVLLLLVCALYLKRLEARRPENTQEAP